MEPVVIIEMKDFKSLIRYLYDSPEETSFRDELMNLAEQIETENKIEVKKGPLSKALSSLGVSIPNDKFVPDYGSVVAHFDSAESYQSAVNSLESPDGMEKLAELGWVMNLCGNSAPGQEDYRIRFLELDLHDEAHDNSTKEIDVDKTMKDVADTFSHDKDDPKRKLQKNESAHVQKAELLLKKVLECDYRRPAKKKLAPTKVSALLKLKKK